VKIGGVEVAIAADVRDDVDIVLLGRDVLQYVKIMLDWKGRSVEVVDP